MRKIEKLIADYDKSDVKPVSFASDKNVNTQSVQFVMKNRQNRKARGSRNSTGTGAKRNDLGQVCSAF
jgi:hypothetical protein